MRFVVEIRAIYKLIRRRGGDSMRKQLKPLTLSLCLLGFMATPAFAVSNSAQVDKLSQQVSALEKQVSQLQAKVNEKQYTQKKKSKVKGRQRATQAETASSASTSAEENHNPISGVATLPTSGTTYLPMDVGVPGQSFVSSGPYIGVPLQFSGGDLIINSPSVNQDYSLLKVRKNIHQRLAALGVEAPDRAHILLSGIVEAQGIYRDIGGGPNSSDVDLTNATLDTYVLGPSQWLSALMSLTYDNNPGTISGSLANNSRDLNSRVYVNQAFVTIGNLVQSPIYGTFGQLYVPFGTYGTNMVSDPLTKLMARTKARAVVLGFQPQVDDTIYAAAYIFKGDTHEGSTSRLNNGGINFGYRFAHGVITSDIGAGVIANIADSVGMQFVNNLPAPTFNGFGGTGTTGNETIAHRVPAYDLRALLGVGTHIDLLAEYIAASTSFNRADMTMNSHGAKPQALDAEAAYTFTAFARPSSVAVGYGMTKDALALQLPAQRYSIVFNTSVWRDTLQSLEFRHDKNYGASNVATGSGVSAPTASGKGDNIVTAQFDLYF